MAKQKNWLNTNVRKKYDRKGDEYRKIKISLKNKRKHCPGCINNIFIHFYKLSKMTMVINNFNNPFFINCVRFCAILNKPT